MSTAAAPEDQNVPVVTPSTDKVEEKLPPLSDHDFRVYNHLAERMNLFVRFLFLNIFNLLCI